MNYVWSGVFYWDICRPLVSLSWSPLLSQTLNTPVLYLKHRLVFTVRILTPFEDNRDICNCFHTFAVLFHWWKYNKNSVLYGRINYHCCLGFFFDIMLIICKPLDGSCDTTHPVVHKHKTQILHRIFRGKVILSGISAYGEDWAKTTKKILNKNPAQSLKHNIIWHLQS